MVILNLILGITEIVVLPLTVWYFMANCERQIYRPRGCYIAAFLGYALLAVLLPNAVRDDRITVIVIVAYTILIGYTLFSHSKAALLYYGIYQALIMAGQTVVIFICMQVFRKLSGGDPLFLSNCILCVKIVMELMLTFFMSMWVQRKTASKAEKGQLAAMIVLLAATIFLMAAVITISDVYMQLHGYTLVSAVVLVLILINIDFIYLFRYMFHANELESEMKLMNQKTELNYRYYTDLEQKYQESRKIIHDMKNHLQAVEALCNAGENEEGKAYMDDLYHMLNVMGGQYYSDVKILNIILNEKIKQAHIRNIEVRAEIGETGLENMRDIDVTAIFANLLDNAIEAAEASKERWIHLKMDTVHEFVVVSLENSVEARQKEGRRQREKGHMGVGLKNVREALERYHGTMQHVREGDRYQVTLMIPK